MKVMIVVTHLLGSGHLTRALTLAQAFLDAGHQVTLVSGGMPSTHQKPARLDWVQLPPVRSDGTDFSRLLDASGHSADESWLASRQAVLVETLHVLEPDVVITELFPFGRRILKEEFQALLAEVAKLARRPRVLASIRDILAPPSKPAKAVFADEVISAFYDGVLVHSDADLTPLELSWPVSTALSQRLIYTGFVAPPPALPHPERVGAGGVIVSAGGGNVGRPLFETAKAAAALDEKRQWRLLVGGSTAEDICKNLNEDVPGNLIAEPARPDFRQMLHHAAASVSMCGYNTALDVLQSPCPAVFVPFDEGNEVEQGIRAEALSAQAGIAMLRAGDMDAPALLSAIERVMSEKRAVGDETLWKGATRTVQIVEGIVGGAHAD